MNCRTAIWALAVGILVCSPISKGIPIDNEVIGDPQVECTNEGINLQVRTRNPFLGRIFVKGETKNPDCTTEREGGRPSYVRPGVDVHDPSFAINFDKCGMYRLRMLNPRGMMYAITIIVSFHPFFITKVDRAYKVQCFYGEIEKTLTAHLNVSDIQTEELTPNAFPMPQCSYTVRAEHLEGPAIKFAKVGEKVVHRWDCDTETYGILVKSCFVEDGGSGRVEVIDSRGCSVDPVLITDLSYDRRRPVAYAETHVFKFADVSRLNFVCQVEICLIHEGDCNGITPPVCANRRKARDIAAKDEVPKSNRNLELDLMDELSVFDVEEFDAFEKYLQLKLRAPGNSSIGISTVAGQQVLATCFLSGIGFVAVVMLFGCVIFIFATAALLFFKRSKWQRSIFHE